MVGYHSVEVSLMLGESLDAAEMISYNRRDVANQLGGLCWLAQVYV